MSTNQIDLMKLFQRIKWAENGDTVSFSETNYGTGWSFLGDDTPTVEDFNTLQQWNDKKDQWLYEQIAKVCQEENIPVTENDLSALLKAIKKIAEQPQASTQQVGVTQLDSSVNSNAEDKAATPKAVKTAYDKGVEAKNAADNALNTANGKQSPQTSLAGYGITDFKVESATGDLNTYRTDGIYCFTSRTNSSNRPGEFTGNLQVIAGGAGNERWCHQIFKRHYSDETYERYQLSGSTDAWSEWKKVGSDGVAVGSVIAFPKEVRNPQGFLRCDGSTFSQNTYPDLYRVLGNRNKLPNLQRSDVGQLAYFPTDSIPDGWLPCDGRAISNTEHPELYRYLNNKYGAGRLPSAEDRFIRNAGNGLRVGDKQEDEIKKHTHYMPLANNALTSDHFETTSLIRDSTSLDTLNNDRGGTSDNAWMKPKLTSRFAEGGTETRPKSIIFKLCIKARNTFDDVQFWIKGFSEVVNSGQLDAARLAQDLQQVRLEKADLSHTHSVSQITDFAQKVIELITQNRGFSQQISRNGWTILPNGLMIQWGVSGSQNVLFPRAFPTECFIVSHSKTAGNRDTRVNNVSNTGFNSYASSHPGTTYYIAIGW